MNNKKGYRKLEVVTEATILVKMIYQSTKNYPREEIFGLTSQLRRAVLSVPLNIVEGHARDSQKEFIKFLNIAIASLVEVEYLLEISIELGYLEDSSYKKLEDQRRKVAVYLTKLRQSMGRKIALTH